MNGILIYNEIEAKRNKFAIEKYQSQLGAELKIIEKTNFKKEFDNKKVDFVVNRSNDYRIAQFFEEKGIRVFNNSFVSKIANDKTLAYDFLSQKSVDIMPIRYKSFPCIVKPNSAKGGQGVRLVKNENEVKNTGNLVFQKCASELGKDLRVYVIGNEIKFSALRENENDIRSNFCLGGSAKEYRLSLKEEEIVKKVIALFKFDFVGIDFLFNSGSLVFNEIEDSVGARMVYSLSNYDIILDYCNYIKGEINRF